MKPLSWPSSERESLGWILITKTCGQQHVDHFCFVTSERADKQGLVLRSLQVCRSRTTQGLGMTASGSSCLRLGDVNFSPQAWTYFLTLAALQTSKWIHAAHHTDDITCLRMSLLNDVRLCCPDVMFLACQSDLCFDPHPRHMWFRYFVFHYLRLVACE